MTRLSRVALFNWILFITIISQIQMEQKMTNSTVKKTDGKGRKLYLLITIECKIRFGYIKLG
jgi:hypothetical protein